MCIWLFICLETDLDLPTYGYSYIPTDLTYATILPALVVHLFGDRFGPTDLQLQLYTYGPDLPIADHDRPSDPPVVPLRSSHPILQILPILPILQILRLSGRASHSEMLDPTNLTVGKAIHSSEAVHWNHTVRWLLPVKLWGMPCICNLSIF